MKEYFKNKTLKIRHGIVKAVAPGLYQDALEFRRPFDFFLKKYFGVKPLIGVEVGVWRGDHAKQMLELLNFKHLYLIDSYLSFAEGDFVFSTTNAENNFKIAKQTVAKFSQVEFLKMLSADGANKIQNNLDFVYIDADHTYHGVKSDLETWYSKVCVGGIFGGHDFSVDFQSVVRAVVNFAYEHNAKLYFKSPDWWIIKGEKNVEFFK
jgi:hypothetical protein